MRESCRAGTFIPIALKWKLRLGEQRVARGHVTREEPTEMQIFKPLFCEPLHVLLHLFVGLPP